jgi:hypothetical protein
MFSFRNYVIPVSLTSLVYTLPRYAELTVVETSEGKHDYLKNTFLKCYTYIVSPLYNESTLLHGGLKNDTYLALALTILPTPQACALRCVCA